MSQKPRVWDTPQVAHVCEVLPNGVCFFMTTAAAWHTRLQIGPLSSYPDFYFNSLHEKWGAFEVFGQVTGMEGPG